IHWAFTTKGSYEYRIAYLNELQARIDFIRTVRKLNKVQVEETLMLSKRVAERNQSEESKAIFNILTEKKP
ncbi:MAG: hypothetical protein ACFFED_18700, partial [Candidatus Thorarchaeota archaeon]